MATANITWTPSSSSGIQSVYYKPYTSSTYIFYSNVSAATSSASIPGLSDNVIYDFKITNDCGTGAIGSGTTQGIILKCPIVSINTTTTVVNYSFTNLGGDINAYEIRLLDSSGATIVQTQTKNSPFTTPITGSFTTLTPNTNYRIKVIPQATGNITYSTTTCSAQTTITQQTCNPPTGLTIAYGNINTSTNKFPVTISWVGQANHQSYNLSLTINGVTSNYAIVYPTTTYTVQVSPNTNISATVNTTCVYGTAIPVSVSGTTPPPLAGAPTDVTIYQGAFGANRWIINKFQVEPSVNTVDIEYIPQPGNTVCLTYPNLIPGAGHPSVSNNAFPPRGIFTATETGTCCRGQGLSFIRCKVRAKLHNVTGIATYDWMPSENVRYSNISIDNRQWIRIGDSVHPVVTGTSPSQGTVVLTVNPGIYSFSVLSDYIEVYDYNTLGSNYNNALTITLTNQPSGWNLFAPVMTTNNSVDSVQCQPIMVNVL